MGNTLVALPVSSIKAIALSSLAEIRNYGLLRPSTIDRKPKADGDEKVNKAHKLHEQTQRSFDKARKDRALSYAAYIKNVEMEGAMGGVPAITLYSEHALELTPEGDGLIIPYNGVLAAIDGETQTEARFILAETFPDTEHFPIAITIYHGVPFAHAKQIVHDVNHYVTPISEVHSASFNGNGAITIAVNKALKASGVSEDKMNVRGAAANAKTVFARVQLMSFLVGCIEGRGVARRGVSASILSRLNSPMGSDVCQSCIESSTEMVVMSVQSGAIGKFNKALWQIAGVLSSEGRSPRELNWSAAHAAYQKTVVVGRGGPRMSMSTKLEMIEKAFTSDLFN